MIDLIMSASPVIFQQYGRQMVAEFDNFAGPDVRLTGVFGGPMPDDSYQHQKRCRFVPFVSADHKRVMSCCGELLSLKQRHDRFLRDHARREFAGNGVKFRNIWGPASATEHPFVNCGVGEFFDHPKGPERRRRGRSPRADHQASEVPQP